MEDLKELLDTANPRQQRHIRRLIDAKSLVDNAQTAWLEAITPHLADAGGFMYDVPRAELLVDRRSVPDHLWQKIWSYEQVLHRAIGKYRTYIVQAVNEHGLGGLPSVQAEYARVPKEQR